MTVVPRQTFDILNDDNDVVASVAFISIEVRETCEMIEGGTLSSDNVYVEFRMSIITTELYEDYDYLYPELDHFVTKGSDGRITSLPLQGRSNRCSDTRGYEFFDPSRAYEAAFWVETSSPSGILQYRPMAGPRDRIEVAYPAS